MRLKSRLSAAAAVTLLLGTVSVATAPKTKLKHLPNDERTITHVLNRIGFGPAPGDVQRVSQMGLEQYIEEQLHPEKLPDNGLRDRLAGFTTLNLSAEQIASKYYIPLQQERKEIQREGFTKKDGGKAAQASQTGQTGQAAETMQDGSNGATSTAANGSANGSANSSAGGAANAAGAANANDQKTLVDGALDLSKLPPEEREKVVELRRGFAQVNDELMQQKLLRAVYSDHQLEEQLVDFWYNHFNVFIGKGPDRLYVSEYERDVIRPHILGKFRDLLGATAHSPAMLFYLDNWQSSDPNADLRRNNQRAFAQPRPIFGPRPYGPRAFPRPLPPPQPAQNQNPQNPQQQKRKPGLNENYARELMELHTLGVNGGYTQQDVIEVAKCFTGWTIDRPQQGGKAHFDDRRHVPGPKMVLGKKIDVGGEGDGEKVLDMLASNPATAKFIATKLVHKFVSDEPPAALVDRVAKTFQDTDGDLREVMRTILTSPEFLAPAAARAKVKTPFEFIASALRATGAQVDDAKALVNNLRQMGMPLYGAQPPTGYVDHAETWVNTGALLNRMNFAVNLVNNRVRGVTVDLVLLTGATDFEATRTALITNMLANEMSDATRATIEKGTEPAQVAALTLGSPEFQRR